MMNTTKTVALPPFRFSLGVYGYQAQIDTDPSLRGTPEQTPHVNEGGSIYLRNETDNYADRKQILSLYRGKAYYTSGIHLRLIQGKWCFVYVQGSEYKYFTPTEVVEWRKDDKPFRPAGLQQINMAVHTTDYNQVVYGDMTIAGKKIVALKLYEEWISYWEANKSALVRAMREADNADLEKQIAKLEAEEKTLQDKIEALKVARSVLAGKRIAEAINENKG